MQLTADRIRPSASMTIAGDTYVPAVTPDGARAIVPELVIVPPDSPVPAVMEVIAVQLEAAVTWP